WLERPLRHRQGPARLTPPLDQRTTHLGEERAASWWAAGWRGLFLGENDRPKFVGRADSGKSLSAPVTELPPHSWLCMWQGQFSERPHPSHAAARSSAICRGYSRLRQPRLQRQGEQCASRSRGCGLVYMTQRVRRRRLLDG